MAAFPYTVSTGPYTLDQLEGEACSCCSQRFAIGEPSRPSKRVLCHQLFAHVVCPKGGATR